MELVQKDRVCLRPELTIPDQNTFWNRVAAALLPLTGEVLAHATCLTWVPVRAFGSSLSQARGQIKAWTLKAEPPAETFTSCSNWNQNSGYGFISDMFEEGICFLFCFRHIQSLKRIKWWHSGTS